MSPSSEPLLYFNGIDGDLGNYFEPPTSEVGFLGRLEGRLPQPQTIPTGIRLDVDPGSLAEAGWGVIWPGEIDGEIQDALSPLFKLRRQQTEAPGPGKFWSFHYRGETGDAFLTSHGASLGGPVKPEDFPYYLLLIGEPTAIPFEFQHRLSRNHLVGRLCFESTEAYANYAANVVQMASARSSKPRRAAIFAPRHSDDPPTESSHCHLIGPVAAGLKNADSWRVESFLAEEATKECLLDLLGGGRTPSILFTAGHSVCYKPTSKVQKAKQGGLLCADWPGPVQWPGSNPPSHFLIAEDIGDNADLRGLISFHFGCYTAGTPHTDSFPSIDNGRVAKGKALTPQPFVAALPKRLLSHPRGALACIGHVDRAWPHSFHWGEIPGQTSSFESAFRGLMAGRTVGQAMGPFAERRSAVSEEVMAFWLSDSPSAKARARKQGELWIAYHDARSYILLGDPAVRLP